MTLTGKALGVFVTLSVVATAAVAIDVPTLSREAQGTVGWANCRAVNTAIQAYVSEEQLPPTEITQVQPYLKGDVSAYRIVAGKAVGPGCD